MQVETIERKVEEYYASVRLSYTTAVAVAAWVRESLASQRSFAEQQTEVQKRRLRDLDGRRKKLLEAYYAGAVPIDLMKGEQDSLGKQMADAERLIEQTELRFDEIEARLEAVMKLIGNCHRAYLEADPLQRRQFNQAFFEKLVVHVDQEIEGELAPPFAIMLGQPNGLPGDLWIEELLRRPRGAGAPRGSKKTASEATMLAGRCSGNDALVRPERVELPTF